MKKILSLLTISFVVFSCTSQPENSTSKNANPVKIEFFETYSSAEVQHVWPAICNWAKENDSLVSTYNLRSSDLVNLVKPSEDNCLGTVLPENVETVKKVLGLEEVQHMLPKELKCMWSWKPVEQEDSKFRYVLYAIKRPKNDVAQLNGNHIKMASTQKDPYNQANMILLEMTPQGSKLWGKMTVENIGKYIAIALDDQVMSCPYVQSAITGGDTQISGNMTNREAEDFAAGINAGL